MPMENDRLLRNLQMKTPHFGPFRRHPANFTPDPGKRGQPLWFVFASGHLTPLPENTFVRLQRKKLRTILRCPVNAATANLVAPNLIALDRLRRGAEGQTN
jgi:hypothetical protein